MKKRPRKSPSITAAITRPVVRYQYERGITGSSKRANFFGRMRCPGGTFRAGPSYTQCCGLSCALSGWWAIAVSAGRNDAKTAFGNEFPIQEHLKPIYPGSGNSQSLIPNEIGT